MTVPGIKSKPVYTGLAPDPAAHEHVLVGEGPGVEALLRLRRELAEGNEGLAPQVRSVAVFYTAGDGPDRGDELLGADHDASRRFPDTEGLCRALDDHLAGAGMGARLYIAGSEAFLWRITAHVRDGLGMSEAAIQMERCGPPARPVCCVHCKTTHPAVSTTIYQCPGCGLNLFVRDHFSRRLGVYQGVCVDAEAPGDVPEPEELDS